MLGIGYEDLTDAQRDEVLSALPRVHQVAYARALELLTGADLTARSCGGASR